MDNELRYDEQGLIPAIAQDRRTGQVRMVAWMSRESLAATLGTGRATFWSRSRAELWEKGATSGNALRVESIWADCDRDTLLLMVEPQGPSCHTGKPSCFFQRVGPAGISEGSGPPSNELERLEETIAERAAGSAAPSYTRQLLEGGAAAIGEKLREEAAELAEAAASEAPGRVANEAADLLYHLLVALQLRAVPLASVLEVLAQRTGRSGLEEKAGRA